MPFPFVFVCDILETLERLFRGQVPLLTKDLNARVNLEVTKWFKGHRAKFDAWDTNADAVMAMLRPDQQHDRVYGITSENLQPTIARALKLSKQQYIDLQQWHDSEIVDLAGCVQRVMQKMKYGTSSEAKSVMVEDIDQALLQIAAFHPSSSAEVRDLAKTWETSDEPEALGKLYRRLQAKEAKWLTRLILKSYAPVKFPDALSMVAGLTQLPRCMSINIQIPSSAPSAVRQLGTGVIRGIVSSDPAPLPTPPMSSPLKNMAQTPTIQINTAPLGVVLASSTYSHSPRSIIEQSPRRSTTPKSPKRSAAFEVMPSPSRRPVLGTISANLPRASPQKSPPNSSPPETGPALRISGHGICRLADDTCKLAGCLFLVSPCVASTPWLMDDMLPRHGARIITSLPALSHPSLPRHCPLTGRRYRKIALVESNRAEHTAHFIKSIGKLSLKRKGRKEWVEVYDWRLLECFTKVEQGRTAGYDPWKRCWIGAV
ncbi:uncharacterized protein LY89DRAFT_684449 [Mollisia scopiformis]|uniref:DNA ligase ATP-dependent N-terminal domain-containing protein n=1 Tax=Mollisia scopiformis TaxID=149040 RepID=A0A194XB46_MOLSC|nr:uncharacterized protein LY89DRAFT_684449 [Mollisia scopiformis]KUJ17388.1 hypothetical protein LY89DRAFT_684449 [Mollisia scopiformis]